MTAPERQAQLAAELTAAMQAHFGDDAPRIAHALRVFGFAQEILAAQPADPTVVAAAALLHDIGIHAAERKHGSAAGRFQEMEGPPIARAIMQRLGLEESSVDHVCRIIANHHSARDIDTPEFRVIWDADWLVNLPEEIGLSACDAQADAAHERNLETAIARIFRTRAGADKARRLFLHRR